VRPDSRVGDVARLILDNASEGAVVLNEQNRLVGIVTEDDLVAKHARYHAPMYLGILGSVLPIDSRRNEDHLRHILSVTAADLMTKEPVVISPDTEVDDAATIMVDKRVEPLIVMDGDTVLGLLRHADVIRLLIVEESDDPSSEES
jgi:CBS domain-containing protein